MEVLQDGKPYKALRLMDDSLHEETYTVVSLLQHAHETLKAHIASLRAVRKEKRQRYNKNKKDKTNSVTLLTKKFSQMSI